VSEEELSHYKTSKWYTFAWGVFCIIVAQFAYKMGSLIEAVNVLGSLFYGVILGIFLVAFYIKRIGGKAVFWSAIISEVLIVTLFILNQNNVIGLSFLWLNVVGALLVVLFASVFQLCFKKETVQSIPA
jgi:Na+/proline symporter